MPWDSPEQGCGTWQLSVPTWLIGSGSLKWHKAPRQAGRGSEDALKNECVQAAD